MSGLAEVYKALAKAQQEMTRAKKATNNPHFKTKYADLESVQDACMPALMANGFAVFQPVVNGDGALHVETVFAHESGASLSCRVPLLIGKNDMQGLGSAITYARRYGLMCMSGVAPEDDDGNQAVQSQKPVPGKQDEAKAIADLMAAQDLEGLRTAFEAIFRAWGGSVPAPITAAKDQRKQQIEGNAG